MLLRLVGALALLTACAGPTALRAPPAEVVPLAPGVTGALADPAAPVAPPGNVEARPPAPGPVPPAAGQGEAPASLVVNGGIPGLPELTFGLEHLRAEFDIPIEVNEQVIRCIRMYQSPGARKDFTRWLARSYRLIPRIRAILQQEGLPQDLVYLAMVESGFSVHAHSHARAVGTWQFIASTARRYGLRQDAWVDERRDPEKAALAAARFLRDLQARTGDWHLTFAAYNAGPGWIHRARRHGFTTFWEMARHPGVLPRETRAYVPSVLAAAIIAKYPEAFGFVVGELEREVWVDYDQVEIRRTTSLTVLARAAGVTVQELRSLNPELRRGATPPRAYALKIPRQSASTFAARWPAMARQEARRLAALHRVKRGDTLWSLSRSAGVSVRDLASWNGIREASTHQLQAGSVVRLEPPGGFDVERPRKREN